MTVASLEQTSEEKIQSHMVKNKITIPDPEKLLAIADMLDSLDEENGETNDEAQKYLRDVYFALEEIRIAGQTINAHGKIEKGCVELKHANSPTSPNLFFAGLAKIANIDFRKKKE